MIRPRPLLIALRLGIVTGAWLGGYADGLELRIATAVGFAIAAVCLIAHEYLDDLEREQRTTQLAAARTELGIAISAAARGANVVRLAARQATR